MDKDPSAILGQGSDDYDDDGMYDTDMRISLHLACLFRFYGNFQYMS